MKSRQYVNTINGLVYWLENDAVMMRQRGSNVVKKSNMDAATFFVLVGDDTLKLIEDSQS